MNKSHETDEPIVDQLNNIQPVADETFQNLLETRLTEAWYQQATKTKQKRKRPHRVPFTFVASLCLVVLAGIVVITLQISSQADYSAPPVPPIPTPLPTLQPYTPSAYPLFIESNMVAITVPLEFEPDAYMFKAGDLVDITATFSREQLDSMSDTVSFEAADLLDSYEADSFDVQVGGNIQIIQVEENRGELVIQVMPQDAVILTWLIDAQVPITMSLTPISSTSD